MVRFTALLLTLLAVVLHAPTIGYDQIDLDTDRLWAGQPGLFDVGFTDGVLAIVTQIPREEPLIVRDFSWLLDATVFGYGNTHAAHLGNVLVNAGASMLAFLFLGLSTRRWRFAFLATLLFTVAPVHVEPVSWLMGRKCLLMAFFTLSALVCQTMAYDARGPRRWAWASLTMIAMVLGLLSKISGLSICLLLLTHRLALPYLRGEAPRSAGGDGIEPSPARDRIGVIVARWVPYGLVTAAITLWYYRIQLDNGMMANRGLNIFQGDHAWTLLRFFPSVVAEYARLLLWPDFLPIFYNRPAIGVAPEAITTVWGLIFLGLIVAGATYAWFRNRGYLFYLSALFLVMIPYSNLTYHGFWVAARYAYVPSLFVAAIAAALVLALFRYRRLQSVLAVAVFVYAAFGVTKTMELQKGYKDATTFWVTQAESPRPSLMALGAASRCLLLAVGREAMPPPAHQHQIRRYGALGRKIYDEIGLKWDLRYPIQYLPEHLIRLRSMETELDRRQGRNPNSPAAAPIDHEEVESREEELRLANRAWQDADAGVGSTMVLAAEQSFYHFHRFCASIPVTSTEERRTLARFVREHYTHRFPFLSGRAEALASALMAAEMIWPPKRGALNANLPEFSQR